MKFRNTWTYALWMTLRRSTCAVRLRALHLPKIQQTRCGAEKLVWTEDPNLLSCCGRIMWWAALCLRIGAVGWQGQVEVRQLSVITSVNRCSCRCVCRWRLLKALDWPHYGNTGESWRHFRFRFYVSARLHDRCPCRRSPWSKTFQNIKLECFIYF